VLRKAGAAPAGGAGGAYREAGGRALGVGDVGRWGGWLAPGASWKPGRVLPGGTVLASLLGTGRGTLCKVFALMSWASAAASTGLWFGPVAILGVGRPIAAA
jgi:hypothetical protein